MTRLPRGPRCRIKLIAGVTAVIAALGTTAYAQEILTEPRPVLDSAPRKVGLKRAATIKGHVENHAPGDLVTLQRAKPRAEWRKLESKRVDERGRVQFRVRGLRSTARYRLAHTDEAGVTRFSADRKIRVRPKLTLKTRPSNLMKGQRITVRGSLRPAGPGRRIKVQRRREGAWRTVKRVRIRDGRYRTTLASGRPGRRSVRVRFSGDARNTNKQRRSSVRVHRPELATWYGPGFYGNRTACGQRLRYGTHGVAHRSLPCGTEVSLLYKGRNIKVRVIDRGPYTSAKYDLTRATADRLNFSGRNHVGVIRTS